MSKDSVTTSWQPIETAPKDGTEILVYTPDGLHGPEIDKASWYVHAHYEYKERADGLFDRVEVTHAGYWNCNDAQHPTHWMSLPEMPNV